jgi:hypothetical protein
LAVEEGCGDEGVVKDIIIKKTLHSLGVYSSYLLKISLLKKIFLTQILRILSIRYATFLIIISFTLNLGYEERRALGRAGFGYSADDF